MLFEKLSLGLGNLSILLGVAMHILAMSHSSWLSKLASLQHAKKYHLAMMQILSALSSQEQTRPVNPVQLITTHTDTVHEKFIIPLFLLLCVVT